MQTMSDDKLIALLGYIAGYRLPEENAATDLPEAKSPRDLESLT